MFEEEITLFNRKYDNEIKDYIFIKTFLTGVNIDIKKAVNVIKSGLENANTGTIIIPEEVETYGKIFLDPKKFKQAKVFNSLSVNEVNNKKVDAVNEIKIYLLGKPENVWTLQPGDIIVSGLIDYTIKGDNNITKLRNEYDYVYEIVSVDPKLKGGLPHWEVGLK